MVEIVVVARAGRGELAQLGEEVQACPIELEPVLRGDELAVQRRATLGLARTGTWSGNGSGDIFVAFSTANRFDRQAKQAERSIRWHDPGRMDPLFQATVEAVEEAGLNAMTVGMARAFASWIARTSAWVTRMRGEPSCRT